MVLNYKCEINHFKLVCPLTVFKRLFQRAATLWWKLFFFQPQCTVLVQINNVFSFLDYRTT